MGSYSQSRTIFIQSPTNTLIAPDNRVQFGPQIGSLTKETSGKHVVSFNIIGGDNEITYSV